MSSISDFSLVFQRRYSMGHRLISGAAPNCRVPHGHDEVVEVEIASKCSQALDERTNMLVEFEQVKGRWFRWIDSSVDHSFHLSGADPLLKFFQENEPELLERFLVIPGDPTTEMRAACFAAKLTAFLEQDNPDFFCRKLILQETPTNAVHLRAVDGKFPVPSGLQYWWNRPDASINDL